MVDSNAITIIFVDINLHTSTFVSLRMCMTFDLVEVNKQISYKIWNMVLHINTQYTVNIQYSTVYTTFANR